MNIGEFAETVNRLSQQKKPFFFMVDFEMQKPVVISLSEMNGEKIWYDFNGKTNITTRTRNSSTTSFEKFPITVAAFNKKFQKVFHHLELGDSYLTNLTIKTRLKTTLSLDQIFALSTARYKLLYKDEFVVFSPEQFIQIRDGKIFSFPMKGTIDASLPLAKEQILNDEKEFAEHVTIVDLIRNDLSMVAENVSVARFRYLEEIRTNSKNLLQVSSEIVGDLPADYASRLGDILIQLLPAGSISGAPKRKTVEIIQEAEGEERGFYTGVAGLFDGRNLDSGVLIRYIEKINGNLFYRSGGGITTQSVKEKEYQEVIDKVYVPIN